MTSWRTTKSPRTLNSFYSSSPSYMSTTTSSSSLHTTKSTTELMSTEHEQPTKLTYPDRTQLTNNDDNCTIRFILADQSDSDQENDGLNIWRFHPTRLLECRDKETNEISNGRYDNASGLTSEETGGNQTTPTDITLSPRSAVWTHTEPDTSSKCIQESNDISNQLQEIPTEGILRCYQSFDHLRTIEEVSNRITQFTQSTGTKITSTEHNWLTTLWILLKDNRLVSTLIDKQESISIIYAHISSKYSSIFPRSNGANQRLQEDQLNN